MHDTLRAIQRHAADRSDKTAVVCGERSVTYAALERLVAGAVGALADAPEVVGLHGPNGIEWIIADLALAALGRTVVPVPDFFSEEQVAYLVERAGIGRIIAGAELSERDGGFDIAPGARKVIFTSGTTGAPKGVVHGSKQLDFITVALTRAAGVREDDIHMSSLPFALLLEQVCGVAVPLTAGCTTVIAPEISNVCAAGQLGPLAGKCEEIRPTTTVLVPQQLKGWTAQLAAKGQTAPDSLRFVAVGGAHVAETLSQQARDCGIPVFEGYGLSECCSVVAVNRPGDAKGGTAGRPLDGLKVVIDDDGEIVVAGDSVMDGYLGEDTTPDGVWRTGDVGAFDEDGFLHVRGRKDDVIVTGYGRNISPAWIEAMLTADPRIAHCAVIGAGRPFLTSIIVLTPRGAAWLDETGHAALDDLIDDLTAHAPDYARPQEWLLLDAGQAAAFFNATGRPDRPAMEAALADKLDRIYGEIDVTSTGGPGR